MPSAKKLCHWLQCIDGALGENCLPRGEAGRLAGRLSFAASNLFMRAGRAMLRPLFEQQYAPRPRAALGHLLRLALEWWRVVLSGRLHQTLPLDARESEVVHLYCDARGVPPRVAAVLDTGCSLSYTDWQPDDEAMRVFSDRRDAQIMGLELMAVVVGLATFGPACAGKMVTVWTDNAGGEGALRAGGAAAEDHNLLTHFAWLLGIQHQFGIWVERVDTKSNVADLPSREEYRLLHELGAMPVDPVVPDAVWHPATRRAVAHPCGGCQRDRG